MIPLTRYASSIIRPSLKRQPEGGPFRNSNDGYPDTVTGGKWVRKGTERDVNWVV